MKEFRVPIASTMDGGDTIRVVIGGRSAQIPLSLFAPGVQSTGAREAASNPLMLTALHAWSVVSWSGDETLLVYVPDGLQSGFKCWFQMMGGGAISVFSTGTGVLLSPNGLNKLTTQYGVAELVPAPPLDTYTLRGGDTYSPADIDGGDPSSIIFRSTL